MNLGFDGDKYRAASTHQKEWGTKLIAELKLKGTEHVLDLGCGDGVLTSQLAALVPRGGVVGIDFSQSMIDAASQHRQSNLRFELLDISQLANEDEFDVVFSNATLHWVRDHANLLRRVFCALKREGVLRFNFAGDGNCSTFIRVVREVMAAPQYADYFRDFEWPYYMPRIDDYRALASQFEFRELKVWGENADRFFPDTEAMIRWIDQPSLLPFLPCVVATQRDGFRAQVIARMISETKKDDGRCFEAFRRINVFARKP
ncbi:MAG: methyltransferase domain-containing protein [Verrucomicrobiales bacterium]|nr:methyltransferase domain-containing protein [Verrucomicrobiales bacterium]